MKKIDKNLKIILIEMSAPIRIYITADITINYLYHIVILFIYVIQKVFYINNNVGHLYAITMQLNLCMHSPTAVYSRHIKGNLYHVFKS